MAEEKTEENEADALERLLEEEGVPVEAGDEEEGGGGKKKLIIIGGAVLLLIILAVAGYFIFANDSTEEEETAVEETIKEEEAEAKKNEEAEKQALENQKNIYKLDPFFLPLKEDGKETGQFINVTILLVLSNQKLDREVENVLPLMRQTIYGILQRKRPRDFANEQKEIEERIKSEIVTSSNALLVSGSGKIEDVLFSEFIVR